MRALINDPFRIRRSANRREEDETVPVSWRVCLIAILNATDKFFLPFFLSSLSPSIRKEKEREEEEEETLSFGQAVSPRIARPSERDPNCRGDNSTHT